MPSELFHVNFKLKLDYLIWSYDAMIGMFYQWNQSWVLHVSKVPVLVSGGGWQGSPGQGGEQGEEKAGSGLVSEQSAWQGSMGGRLGPGVVEGPGEWSMRHGAVHCRVNSSLGKGCEQGTDITLAKYMATIYAHCLCCMSFAVFEMGI